MSIQIWEKNMKRKLFTIFVFVFGLCGVLGYFNIQNNIASAVSVDASVWDGETVTSADDLTVADFYNDNNTYYYIRSAKGLSYFSYLVNSGNTFKRSSGLAATVYLEADIDLHSYNWTPVGIGSNVFQGNFDGQGHTIYNMQINSSDIYAGFFGHVGVGAKVSNISLKNANITVSGSNTYVGALVGYLDASDGSSYKSTTLSESSASGEIFSSGLDSSVAVGGLVGYSKGATMKNLKAKVNMELEFASGENFAVGGVLGKGTYSQISANYSEGNITVTTAVAGHIGGLVGQIESASSSCVATLNNSYNVGTINASGTNSISANIGGLVGYVAGANGTSSTYFSMSNCYNVGTITNALSETYSYVGGLIGKMDMPASNYGVKLLNSFNFGDLKNGAGSTYSASASEFSNATGWHSLNSRIENLSSISNQLQVKGLYSKILEQSINRIGGQYATSTTVSNSSSSLSDLAKTADFYKNARYWTTGTSWDFSDTWAISAGINNGYAYLQKAYNVGNANNDADYSAKTPLAGKGTAESPYLIETAADLGWLSFNYSSKSGAYFSLQNDIDLTGRTWRPIGTKDTPFKGVFDGNGFTISGMTCSLQEQFGNHGLFGVTQNAVIKNLKLTNVSYSRNPLVTSDTKGNVGTLVGLAKNNTYIINCRDTSSATLLGETGSVKTVGKVDKDATLNIFFGLNNVNFGGTIYPENITVGSGTINYGYDIAIDGKGGNFYNITSSGTKTLYKDTYHILVMPTGKDDSGNSYNTQILGQYGTNLTPTTDSEVVSIKSDDGKYIDSTYGANIPQLSTIVDTKNFSGSDIVMRRGYKATGYSYAQNSASATNFTLSGENAVTTMEIDYSKHICKGLYLTWESAGFDESNPSVIDKDKAVKVYVVYNAYELENFGATNTDNAVTYTNSDLKIDTDGIVTGLAGAVYKEFNVEYDSYFSDAESAILFETPTYTDANGQTKTLRDGKFEIESANGRANFYKSYKDSTFGNLVTSGSTNDIVNKDTIVYVKWVGTGDKYNRDNTLTVNFTQYKDEKIEGYFAGKFDLADAIESVSFNGDEDEKLTATSVNFNDGKVTFSFSTNGLSSATHETETEGLPTIVLTLKDGYEVSGIKDSKYSSGVVYDTNFGVLTSSNEVRTNLDFDNLVGSYETTFVITRTLHQNDVNIGEGVYFGFSPKIGDWTEVAIKNNNTWENLSATKSSFDASKNTTEEKKYVGIDFKNQRIMTSNTEYDSADISTYFYDNSTQVSLRYTFSDGSTRYFVYRESKITSDNGTITDYIFLYETDGNGNKLDEVGRLVYESATLYHLEYYTNSTFALLFTTEIDSTSFGNYSNLNDGVNVGADGTAKTEVLKISESSSQPTKIMMTLDKIVALKDAGGTGYFSIDAVTVYTEAAFQFKLKYLNSDGNLVDFGGDDTFGDAPKLDKTSGVYTTSTGSAGEITFTITKSDYYRFYDDISGTSSAILYNKDSYNGLISYNEKYNLKITANHTNPKDAYSANGATSFNDYNGWYLSVKSITSSIDKDTNQEQFEIVLTYNDTGNTARTLKPGSYEVEIVCTDVLYGANVETKFITMDETPSATYDEYTDDSNSGIVTTVTSTENIKFGDTITFETSTENQAYVFYGWRLQGDNYTEIKKTTEQTLSFVYGEEYRHNNSTGRGQNNYNISVYAIYQRKQVSVTLSPYVVVSEENGGTNSPTYLAVGLGLSLNFANVGSDTYTYIYQSDKDFATLSLVMSGENANGYYISGYKLCYNNDKNVVEYESANVEKIGTKDEIINSTDLSIIKTMMENGATANKQSYYLVPVVRQKTADVAFYSGTGTSGLGDGKTNGQVFDSEANNSTDTIFKMQTVYFGTTLYLNQNMTGAIDNIETTKAIDNLYYARTGYSTSNNNYWAWTQANVASDADSTIDTGYIARLDATLFAGSGMDTNITLNFYKKWTANEYYLSFNANGGSFGENTILSVKATYDSNIFVYNNTNYALDEILNTSDFSKLAKVGYEVSGWNYSYIDDNNEAQEVKIFDSDLSILDGAKEQGLFDENGNFVRNADLTVVADWSAKLFKIQVNLNGANSYQIGTNAEEGVSDDEQLDKTLDFYVYYGSTFEHIYLLQSGDDIFDLSNLIVKREGFTLDGFYAISGSGNQTAKIDSSTTFNDAILSSDFSADVALTLYAGWNFRADFASLSLNNQTLANLTYCGATQTVYVADYFEQNGYNATAYEVTIEGQQIAFSLPTNMHASVETVLSSSTATVADEKDLMFGVRNAGQYYANLILKIVDEARYLNNGTMQYDFFNLSVAVDKASVNFDVDDSIYLKNVKKMMSGLANAEEYSSISKCNSLSAFAQVIKSIDSTVTGDASDMDIYSFVMTKYFLISNTNDGAVYKTYKAWTYADFVAYKTENAEEVETLLNNLLVFEFYDHTQDSSSVELSDTSSFGLVSDDASNVKVEIVIDKIEMTSGYADVSLIPKNSYDLYIYLGNYDSKDDYLANYNVNTDDDDNKYLVYTSAYLMPERMVLKNLNSTKTAYFESGVENRSIAWQGDRKTLDYDGETYYALESNLYIKADVYTSSGGTQTADTEFGYAKDTNYLYVANVTILSEIADADSGENYYEDVTSYFSVILDQNDIFTILNTDGVAQINIYATYFTDNDGATYFETIAESMAEGLLRITQVNYTLDGTAKSKYDSNGLEAQSFSDGGVLVYQILKNQSNSVSIYINDMVTSVVVSTISKDINDYIGLYKWSNGATYSIDGTMTEQTSYTIEKDDIFMSTSGLTTANYYAIYTDLVLVNYDLSFPSTYTAQTSKTSYLKLGSSTVANLNIPAETGFTLSSLKAKTPDGALIDYVDIFTGADSGNGNTFVGITSSTRHSAVNLVAKWNVEDITYTQTLTSYTIAVKSFDSLSASNVVSITNQNTNIYDYSYEWYFNDTLVSSSEVLKLKEQGSFNESGQYKLVITATMNEQFAVCLDDTSNTSSTVEVTFTLNFIKNKVDSVEFAVNSAEITYDALEHIYDWQATINYFVYNSDEEDYYTTTSAEQLRYVTTGSIYFKIFFNGGEVSSIKNAGTYRIVVCFDDTMYDYSALTDDQKEFVFTVDACSVDLSDKTFEFEKQFNATEPAKTQDVSLTNEIVTLEFSRGAGEDVGSYDLYFKDIQEDVKTNYIFTFGDTILFENGTLTETGATTVVGTFTIKQSGILRLSYTITDANPALTAVQYSTEGYSLKLTDNFVLQIYNGSSLYKTFALDLYDVTAGTNIVDNAILNVLKTKVADITPKFFASQYYDVVTNSGVYSYAFEMGEEISKYFSLIEFESSYQFSVGQTIVDVSKINLKKTYDGKGTDYYDLSLNKIDLTDFEGVYIVAAYSSSHVGENIRVNLSLMQKGDSENLSNYAVSENYAYGEISKRSANATVVMTQESYTYGEISIGDINSKVKELQLVDANGTDLSDILSVGYYTISYSVATTNTNEKGFLYKGTYQLQVTADFKDFVVNIAKTTFAVTLYTYSKSISSGYIQITASDVVKDYYEETINLPATGDSFVIKLKPQGLTAGQQAQVGSYNLQLVDSSFLNGSVTVAVTENNQGFEVLSEATTLYAKVTDSTIFSQQYNGETFTLAGDTSNATLSVTNGASKFESGLTFYTKDETGTETTISSSGLTFKKLDIYISGNLTQASDAGNYKISLVASCEEYTNIVFGEEYFFDIAKRTVDISKLNLRVVYKSDTNYTISTFDEKVENDVVSILAKFEDANAGEDKNINLYLNGQDMNNYQLSSQTATGTILKADATIQITKNSVVYGTYTNLSTPEYKIISGSSEIYPSEYSVEFEIENATYSSRGYLEVGEYQITLKSKTSTNYDIAFAGDTLKITPYGFVATFDTNGKFVYYYGSDEAKGTTFVGNYDTPLSETIDLTLTRERGTALGYYKVTGGEVKSNSNYTLDKVNDTSDQGAFRIIYAKEKLYLFASSESTLSSTADATILTITYDGNLYNQIAVTEREEDSGLYKIVISSATNLEVTHEFDLNFYTYNKANDTYTLVDAQATGLSTTISFVKPNSVKNVGSYDIYATGTASSAYDVRLGAVSSIYCFTLNIEQKELYFTSATISKIFDNQNVELAYDDASTFLTGIVAGDALSANIKFVDQDGNSVKYVGDEYTLDVTLSGEAVSNYHLNIKTESGQKATGTIARAKMQIIVNSQTYTYGAYVFETRTDGSLFTFDYKTSTDVDLTGYDTSRLNLLLGIGVGDYSSIGALKVGQYALAWELNNPLDFELVYLIDNVERDNLGQYATITITKKSLELVKKTENLADIFTKTYDGENSVDLFDENGDIRFDISGICTNSQLTDVVTIESATYATETIGNAIQVSFVLGGNDGSNYELSPWLYGVINPIEVAIKFEYEKESGVHSNVDDNRLETLSSVAYPFMSTAYLTANSTKSTTSSVKNFPTSLSGKAGHSFLYWTMDFANIANASAELAMLQKLVDTYGLEFTYENTTFSVKVDNGEKTVKFLNALIGEDTGNLLGYYYKDNSAPTITFNANWDTNKQSITVVVTDTNGNRVEYATVTVNDGTTTTTITSANTIRVNYNSSLTLQVSPIAHCSFEGFFDEKGNQYTNSQSGISIVGDKLTVASVQKDYYFYIKIKTQTINIVYDLSNWSGAVIDTTTPNATNFKSVGDGKYQWTTDYIVVQNLKIADLPKIIIPGYNLEKLSVTVTEKTSQPYGSVKTDSTTLLTIYLDADYTDTATIEFKPDSPTAVGVAVTLDYGYQNADGSEKTSVLTVLYDKPYENATGWEENPKRDGYDFMGWYNADGVRVVGSDTMSTENAHTLTAHWQKGAYNLTLVSPNAIVLGTNVTFSQSGENYSLTNIEFESQISFKVTAQQGYEISSAWSSEFVVTLNADGTADISLTMPGNDIEYILPIVPITNQITLSLENIESVEVFDTESESQITVQNNAFDLQTGQNIRVVVTARQGFALKANSMTINDQTGLTVGTPTINGQTLTVEIEGIFQDITIGFVASPESNDISVIFDQPDNVEKVEDSDGRAYSDIANLPAFEVSSGEEFVIFVKYKHGYTLDSCTSDDFVVNATLITDESNSYAGYYKVEIATITSSGTINIATKYETYTLAVEVLSYNENKVNETIDGNIAYVDGSASATVDYLTIVTLTYQTAELYSFAGWSKDGINIFSNETALEYQVTDNEKIYAIFSKLEFNFTFGTIDYYNVYTEYNDANKTQSIYSEIQGGSFVDPDTAEELDSGLKLYYGASKIITFVVPDGYTYYGYGYKKGTEWKIIPNASPDREISIEISTLEISSDVTNIKIYAFVRALATTLRFETYVDVDGTLEDNVDVGEIEIKDKLNNSVNAYGYLDGTRVHYSTSSFANGELVNSKEFDVVAYTGDTFYLLVKVLKAGYKFSTISSNRPADIEIQKSLSDDYILYSISNFKGGDESFEIYVTYKPIVNIINLNFESDNEIVDGGVFSIKTTTANSNKVWNSGKDYISVIVSAYTDSSFDVVAYIRAGFYIDSSDIQIVDESGIVDLDSINFSTLSITTTGYTGKLSFAVSGYLGSNEIKIVLKKTTYTVLLKEDETTLAKIKHVNFDSILNLYESNSDNIEIYDEERIYYLNGKLIFTFIKEKHNFEGFFTYQNGAGVRYINSYGNADAKWQESGYVFNPITSQYEYSDTVEKDSLGEAMLDSETGEITINLYLYMSYLKTRITFELVPNIDTNYTAQDMVSGVDYTNSWFYETAPLYIEIAFNTDVYIVAPEIKGYKFYKFIISQKNLDGTWLTDVTSYLNDIPWSTTEYDQIVECKIQVVYFAQVEVTTFGGEGEYAIRQDLSETQAKTLLQQGYVDTSKPFIVTASPNEGYTFLNWMDATTGKRYYTETVTLTASQMTSLVLNLRGEVVTLDFSNYDSTFGQILNLEERSLDNSSRIYRVGGFSGNQFLKLLTMVDVKVGDRVIFTISVDYGFGITFDDDLGISLLEYSGGYYYFDLSITSEMAGKTIEILPTFKDQLLSIYISSSFVEDTSGKDPIDYNLVSLAGTVTFEGKSVKFVSTENNHDISLGVALNDKYGINKIVIKNYDNTFDNMEDFYDEEKGEIVLTTDYLSANDIVGTIQLLIEYKRLLWEDEILEIDHFEGSGTTESPYKISTIEDLVLMMQLINNGETNVSGVAYKNCAYILMDDLQLSGKFWTPIGTSSNAFNGSFDFNDHQIVSISLAYYYSPISYNGLFGVLGSNAKIIKGATSYWYVYMIVGIVVGAIALLIMLILLNRKRKKRRQQLATK